MFRLAALELEIPAMLGDLLFPELSKGAGHKYIRRLPTGNPKKPWRYIYNVAGGKGGLGAEAEFEVGAKFKVRHGDREGHFEIIGKTPEGKLQIRHDESGHVDVVAPEALAAMLRNEHAAALTAHREKVRSDLAAVGQYGTAKQRAALIAYAQAHEHTRDLLAPVQPPEPKPEPKGKVPMGEVKEGQRIKLGGQIYEFTGSGWAEITKDGKRTGAVTTNRDIARRSGGTVDLWEPGKGSGKPKEPGPKDGESNRDALKRQVEPSPKPPEPAPEPQIEPTPDREVHEEVGEHVGRSRKDQAVPLGARDLAGGVSVDDVSTATRDKLISRPTAAESKAAGYSPGAHHLRDAIFKAISQTPVGGRSEKWGNRNSLAKEPANVRAAHFITGCAFVEKTLAGCKTAEDIMTALQEMHDLREADFQSEKVYPIRPGERPTDGLSAEDRADALTDFHAKRGYESSSVSVIGQRFVYAPETKEQRLERVKAGKSREPVGRMAVIHDHLQAATYARRFDALGEAFSNITKAQPTDGFRKVVAEATELDKSNWESVEQARLEGARKVFNWADLRGEAFDRVGGRQVAKASGPQMAEDMGGLRNVQYGEWMSQDDREHHVKAAHTALFDLADMLGVDPKTVSLKGRLAIGFGARGKGGKGSAAAHYEPDLKIINLTKFAGGGTLAHEWGHFLDNIIGETHGTQAAMTGEAVYGSERLPDTAPQALRDAYEEVGTAMFGDAWKARRVASDAIEAHNRIVAEVNAMTEKNVPYRDQMDAQRRLGRAKAAAKLAMDAVDRASTTQFHRDASALGSKYWGSTREMFARAFESFMEDKLKSQGRKNTYLVQGTQGNAMTFSPAPRDPKKVRAERAAAAEEAAKHPEHVTAKAKADGARLAYERILGEQIQRAHPKARPNAFGSWNDQYVFEAQRTDVVQAASREMYEAQRAVTAVRDRVTRKVSEVHDGTEHPPMAQPYPKGEERSRINAAFERFVTAIRETGAIHKAQYLDGMDALRVRISRIQETA
jgi:hypothetical protein